MFNTSSVNLTEYFMFNWSTKSMITVGTISFPIPCTFFKYLILHLFSYFLTLIVLLLITLPIPYHRYIVYQLIEKIYNFHHFDIIATKFSLVIHFNMNSTKDFYIIPNIWGQIIRYGLDFLFIIGVTMILFLIII